MIELLEGLIPRILASVQGGDEWSSLILNRRKPWTYRVFRYFGENRVCLHAFDPCAADEINPHPHPWPGAILMLQGAYIHNVGWSAGLRDDPVFFYREIVRPYSVYEITDRRMWHSVQPLQRCYSLLVNGPPWQDRHRKVRTTKGIALDSMTAEDLRKQLDHFVGLLTNYLEHVGETRPVAASP